MKTFDRDPVMMALAYPFERGDIDYPPEGDVLLANAVPAPGPWDPERAMVWQWWKGPADAFEKDGFKVSCDDPSPRPSHALVLARLPRQREEAQFVLAASWAALRAGGLFVAAAANDSGGARLEKDLIPYLPGLQSASKYKCRIVWCRKAGEVLPVSWMADGRAFQHPDTALWTRPGLFSWNRLDPATALLLSHIPAGLIGRVADPGCGAGVIADYVLKTSPQAQTMLCIDADARAIAACRMNLSGRHAGRDVEYHWSDLSRPQAFSPVDTVIMNPPFHAEKAQAIDLGRSFIGNAAAMLKPGGSLWMVANAHLPYEALLVKNFKTLEKCHEGQGFKIFHAKR